MKIKKTIILFLTMGYLLSACGGGFSDAKKALTNQKRGGSDEFFIKKQGPLTLPPDYEQIPEPDSMTKKKGTKKGSIEDILNIPKKAKKVTSKNKSTEQSIINQIKK